MKVLSRLRRHIRRITTDLGSGENETGFKPIAIRFAYLPRCFVIRPGGKQGKRFLDVVGDLEVKLQEECSVERAESLALKLEQEVREFASQQVRQVDETVGLLSSSLEELLWGLEKNVVDQSSRIGDIQRIKSCIGQAESAQSLEETKGVLSAGLAGITRLFEKELELQKELREVHERHSNRLQLQLKQVEKESRIDALTGVANRAGIEKQLKAVCDHARTNGAKYTFALLDLDGFKRVNDGLGHVAGDLVLSSFAQRLQAAVGNDGFIGRLGGDEFVVITSVESGVLLRMLHRLNEQLCSHPLAGTNRSIPVTASFGITKIDKVCELEELVSSCDTALYENKAILKSA